MPQKAWSEKEIKAAVKEYFKLLDKQNRGLSVNKFEIYRSLSKQFPQRSPRAFERKFTNISAILYEEKLPYIDGLKPCLNYQNLLKLIVIDFIKKNIAFNYTPRDILRNKIISIHKQGRLECVGNGAGRYGLAVEKYLQVPQNSNKSADFMGIELKTSVGRTLQTLFARSPTSYLDCKDKKSFLLKHGYLDEIKDRVSIYTAINSKGDSLGFSLRNQGHDIYVSRNGQDLLHYKAEVIEEALLSKMSEVAFLKILPTEHGGFSIASLTFAKWPSILRFMDLIKSGAIHLDISMSIKEGRIKDHGFSWRIPANEFHNIFLENEVIEL